MAKLHDIEVDDFLAQSVQVNALNLQQEFVQLPAQLAYWNEKYARAMRAFLGAKIERERTEARLHTEMRETLMLAATSSATAAGGKVKAPTVSDIEAAVQDNDEFVAAKDAELEADIEKTRVYGVIDAIRAKKDMLIQMGAHIRAEMEGSPSLRDASRLSRNEGEADGLAWGRAASDATGGR